jgi:hypothetical protein
MNIVDSYRLKNNQFNWSELFNIASQDQLTVIQMLLTAEMSRRTTPNFGTIIPTPYTPTQIPLVDYPSTIPSHPSHDYIRDRIYIGDPITQRPTITFDQPIITGDTTYLSGTVSNGYITTDSTRR